MAPTDCNYIDSSWYFAMAKHQPSAGPEFAGLHSVKMQVLGHRRVLVAEFEKLETFMRGTIGANGTLSLARITETLAEASIEILTAMLTSGVEIWDGLVEEGHTLLVPWGFIVCETCVNQQDTAGFRFTLIGDEASKGFLNLASYMMPTGGQTLKQNTTGILLKKVVDGLSVSSGEQPKYHAKVQKPELEDKGGPKRAAPVAAKTEPPPTAKKARKS